MPGLDTVINANTTQVDVVVENVGGGGNPPAYVQVCVCWDPNVLQLIRVLSPTSGVKDEPNYGYCVWYGHRVNPGARNTVTFSLLMCRLTAAATYVTTYSTDPSLGYFTDPPKRRLIRANLQSCNAIKLTVRKSKKAKGRKKA